MYYVITIAVIFQQQGDFFHLLTLGFILQHRTHLDSSLSEIPGNICLKNNVQINCGSTVAKLVSQQEGRLIPSYNRPLCIELVCSCLQWGGGRGTPVYHSIIAKQVRLINSSNVAKAAAAQTNPLSDLKT